MNDIFDNLRSHAELLDEDVKPTDTNVEVESDESNEDVVNDVNADETDETVDEADVNEDEVDYKSTKAGEGKGDDTPWRKPGKTPKGVLERFRKLNERDRQKEARITELESVIKKFIETSGGNKPSREPTLQDFLEAGKSEQEFIDYLVNQRIEQRSQADYQRRQHEEVLRKKQEEINNKWTNAYKIAVNDLPDYDEVVSNVDIQIPTTTMAYIAESDIGPYITYTIASNDDLQSKIDGARTIADKHAIILEVEKNVRGWLNSRNKKVSNSAGAQPQKTNSNTKLKVPGSVKTGKSTKTLDPATASIEEWLGL